MANGCAGATALRLRELWIASTLFEYRFRLMRLGYMLKVPVRVKQLSADITASDQ